jgi:cell division protein FtsA
MTKKHTIVAGLDIGTSKVAAVIGEMTGQGVEIIGLGTHPSVGLRKGVVINIDHTVAAIKKAVDEAEMMAGCEIHSVFTSVGGSHIKGFNSHGVVAVKNKEVGARDLERVIDAAKAVAIPAEQEVIHVVPQEFILDEQDGIREPLGMSAVRLEARVHILTGSSMAAQNVIKCCNRAGLSVAGLALMPLSTAEAVLNENERELGVVIVDMGAGTVDIAVYHDGSVRHSAVLPIGGNHVTNDIVAGLRTAFADAERIKQRYGLARASMAAAEERIEVPSAAGKAASSISRQILCEIIEPRLDEVFQLVRQEIGRCGYAGSLASGAVVTGGSLLLAGAVEMAERVLEMPARLGVPTHIRGLVDVISSPVYATGAGLVLYGMKHQERSIFGMPGSQPQTESAPSWTAAARDPVGS